MDLGGRSSGSVSRPGRTTADGNQSADTAKSAGSASRGCGQSARDPTQAMTQAPDMGWPSKPQ